MIKYSVLLATTLCAPFTLDAMELTPYKIPISIGNNVKSVQHICNETHSLLEKIREGNTQKRDIIAPLVSIIDVMHNLRQACPPVHSREVGLYVFKETSPAKFEAFFCGVDIITSAHVSAFFTRLDKYIGQLEQNQYISPNKAQIFQHFKNEKVRTAAEINRRLNIPVEEEVLQKRIIAIPTSVAIEMFITFLKDVHGITQLSSQIAKRSVKLTYHDELTKPSQRDPVIQQ